MFLFSIISYAQDDYIKQGYVKQSRLPRSLQKFQIGISSVGAAGYYKSYFDSKVLDRPVSVYYEGPTVSKGGLGLTLGTYSRLAKLGKRAAVTWDFDFMYNMIYWKGIGTGYYIEREWNNGGTTRQIALATGLDLKIGSDARLEKNHRYCLSFGAGIMPMYNRTKLQDSSKKPPVYRHLGFMPYMKFEVGLFTGFCWKIRVNYAVGDYKLVENGDAWNKNNPFGVSSFNLRGNNTLTVSLVLMPFSYDWPDNGWWNNSRNSYKMYKGWKARHKNYY
ncbi:hypothetical protein CAP35_00585 [Chitinophagaceae bacterium IBVUCB1]|nr:hypothetical protein CAP35_00585 [Chitinophagaceae bacterium IBVUCB1]